MIELRSLQSQSLKNFPLQQNPTREYAVYLPPGYSKSQKYPSIYILSAWGNLHSKYLSNDSVFGRSLPELFDEAISSQKIAPVILIFPDASTKWGSSQFINSSAFGSFQNLIADEIVSAVDQEFSTIPAATHRGVMGHSSGGFGALHFCFQRPDRFQLCASAAGDSFFELNLLSALLPCLQEIEKAGSIEKLLNDFLDHPNPGSLGSSKMMAMMLLSLAPCYAPRPKLAPLYGELFFDTKTGKIRPDVWEEYLKWDPVRAVASNLESIKKLKFIFLDAGIHDEFGAQFGHRQLFEELKRVGAKVEIEEFMGRHSGHNHRFVERARKLLAHL